MSGPEPEHGLFTAVGLMSGTSMDGIDAAIVRTDGRNVVHVGAALTLPYGAAFRQKLRRLVMTRGADRKAAQSVGRELTLAHLEAVEQLLAGTGLPASAIDVIGFHGHTILHNPAERFTWQIGEPDLLAERLGVTVVGQFRLADVKAGGQGAPLVPLYHAARAARLEWPIAVLNIGGVANVTWLADDRGDWSQGGGGIVAFDTGPGNALIDDFVFARTGRPYDAGGALSLSGTVDQSALSRLMDNRFFDLPPPKSLDRNEFDVSVVARLPIPDGAATLAAFTVQTAARAISGLGQPKRVLVCGGGRLNRALMAGLAAALPGVAVQPVESVGWRGDAMEAEAFGYLAVRSLEGLPLSLPSTTGVPKPMPGGERHDPAGAGPAAAKPAGAGPIGVRPAPEAP
jgi:anhydro-N-acetylmuramic acid kinase